MARWRRSGPFRPLGGGRTGLVLDDHERALLGDLLGEFRPLLDHPDDPATRRLFPAAYASDPEREAEYRQFMRDELAASRVSAVDVVTATLQAEELEADELQAWLQTLNGLRLVLGTRLDVSEDSDPSDGLFVREGRNVQLADTPDAMARFAYLWLSELLEAAVRAASESLG
jgi:hypothetical protein